MRPSEALELHREEIRRIVKGAHAENPRVFGSVLHGNNIARRFPDFVDAHPELPLRSAYDMRNALSHGYFGVDLQILWRAIRRDLPELRRGIEAAQEADR
jgi:uncharacterized protein with HEPN domain